MEERKIEGLWDCAYCNQKAIKARFDSCPSCSRPRGIETVFYLPKDIEGATLSKEEEQKVSNMPDWLCEYCGSYNDSQDNICENCGASKSDAKRDYGVLHRLTDTFFRRRK